MALLVLNLKGYTIGASAWCPGGRCWVDGLGIDSERRVHRFDRQGHNLLGALQLVAKVLEIWFELVAVALVYLMTIRLTGIKEGLPIGYLNRPNEFADIPGLLDKLLWTSLPSRKGPQADTGKAARWRIWIFILLSVLLCIICNLVGPAIAVLLIPTLSWTKTPEVAYQTFLALNSTNPPLVDGFAYNDTFGCSCDDPANYRYSCTDYDSAEKLDAWATSWVVAAAESSFATISQQDELIFTVNTSQPDAQGQYHIPLYWVPSRQLVSTFSQDADNIASISLGNNATGAGLSGDEFNSYKVYNKSQQSQLQRNGHISRAWPNLWYDYQNIGSWTTTVNLGRALQCFSYYKFGYCNDNNYTKCIQDGSGWGPNTKYATFAVEGGSEKASDVVGLDVHVEVFSSDRVAFLPNGTMPAGVPEACLTNGTVPAGADCDWDVFFAAPGLDVSNATSCVTTLRFSMNNSTYTVVATVDYVTYFGWVTYTLNPYPEDNPLLLVQTQSLPTKGEVVPVDPAWTLAAWSVDSGGALQANRSSIQLLQKVPTNLMENQLDWNTNELTYEYQAVAYVPVLQTLSVVEYTFNETHVKPTKAAIENQGASIALSYCTDTEGGTGAL